MRRYVLTASLNGSTTSLPLNARNDEQAKTLAHIEINKRYVADKRYAKGEVTLTSQFNKEEKIINIPAEEN